MKTLSIFSDIQSSFDSKFENENGGEIPRRSVDQGLSTSPKSTTVDLYFMLIIREIYRNVNYYPLKEELDDSTVAKFATVQIIL